MFEPDKDGVIASMSASPIRRLVGVTMLILLGILLVYVAFTSQSGFVGRIFILVMGIVSLVYADMLRRATQNAVLLTVDGLVDSAGRMIAPMAEIESVQRGAFAFKPSHGFSLVMNAPQQRAWAPGLWWRFGKRVGVGGVTPAGASRFMAEQIAFRLAQ